MVVLQLALVAMLAIVSPVMCNNADCNNESLVSGLRCISVCIYCIRRSKLSTNIGLGQ